MDVLVLNEVRTVGQPKEIAMYSTTAMAHNHNKDHNGEHVALPVQEGRAAHGEHEDISKAAAPRTAEQRKRTGRRVWLILGVIAVGAVGAAAASTWPRLHVHAGLAETTRRID